MNSILQPVDDLLTANTDALTIQATQIANLQSENAALNTQIAALQPPVVFDALETLPWLVAGGTAANSGSVGNTATSTQTVPTNLCATFGIQPQGAYADKYFYLQLGAQPNLVHFKQEGSFLFPSPADAANTQAIEFDLQQVIGGVVYNFGWQFDYAEKILRYWDRAAGSWVATGVVLTRPAPLTWVTCTFATHRDASNIYYDQAIINGVIQHITPIHFPAPSLGLSDMLNYGFQLDGEKVPNTYTICRDRMKLTGWAG